MMADAFSEIGGSLFGKQKIRVLGIGDVNRKSVGGTVSGFVASLALCAGLVLANHLSPAWLGLAIVISVSNTVLELFSPRGTDDFVMASANAVICLAFGLLMY
jgi:dolichol kinase